MLTELTHKVADQTHGTSLAHNARGWGLGRGMILVVNTLVPE